MQKSNEVGGRQEKKDSPAAWRPAGKNNGKGSDRLDSLHELSLRVETVFAMDCSLFSKVKIQIEPFYCILSLLLSPSDQWSLLL